MSERERLAARAPANQSLIQVVSEYNKQMRRWTGRSSGFPRCRQILRSPTFKCPSCSYTSRETRPHFIREFKCACVLVWVWRDKRCSERARRDLNGISSPALVLTSPPKPILQWHFVSVRFCSGVQIHFVTAAKGVDVILLSVHNAILF